MKISLLKRAFSTSMIPFRIVLEKFSFKTSEHKFFNQVSVRAHILNLLCVNTPIIDHTLLLLFFYNIIIFQNKRFC